MNNPFSIPRLNLDKRKWPNYAKGTENDPIKIQQREKQINYFKNTDSYQFYCETIPKNKRQAYHPKTPRSNQKCAIRNFRGQLSLWKTAIFHFGLPYLVFKSFDLGQRLVKYNCKLNKILEKKGLNNRRN